jgi:hypothetical protein
MTSLNQSKTLATTYTHLQQKKECMTHIRALVPSLLKLEKTYEATFEFDTDTLILSIDDKFELSMLSSELYKMDKQVILDIIETYLQIKKNENKSFNYLLKKHFTVNSIVYQLNILFESYMPLIKIGSQLALKYCAKITGTNIEFFLFVGIQEKTNNYYISLINPDIRKNNIKNMVPPEHIPIEHFDKKIVELIKMTNIKNELGNIFGCVKCCTWVLTMSRFTRFHFGPTGELITITICSPAISDNITTQCICVTYTFEKYNRGKTLYDVGECKAYVKLLLKPATRTNDIIKKVFSIENINAKIMTATV